MDEKFVEIGDVLEGMKKLRLCLVVNTISPYRLPIYAALGQRFDTTILHGGSEANRTWKDDIPEHLSARKVWTVKFRLKKATGIKGVSDTRYFHLNLGLLWQLPRAAPDIVISNELGIRTLISIVYARVAGIPHWTWWGGTIHSEQSIGRAKQFVRRTIARAIPFWISYGETSTEYLESIGVRRLQILQIQNCVPEKNFQAVAQTSERWLSGEPKPILLVVGQLIARKGLNRFLEACGRMVEEGHRFTAVLVGNGPDKAELELKAKTIKIPHFHIFPNQSQESLNILYRSAQVLVFPTLEDVWGLVVNEAIWAGLPVLCSKYAGCAPEIVPVGNVFDPNDPLSFDRALRKVFSGQLSPSDSSLLLTCDQVSDLIIQSLSAGRPIR